jgi:hypothetical protein
LEELRTLPASAVQTTCGKATGNPVKVHFLDNGAILPSEEGTRVKTMDKDTPDPMRDALLDASHWATPAESAAARKRKDTEPKRILGAVILSGILSAILGASVGSFGAFVLFWMVSGLMLTSWATSGKEGPGT